MARKKKQPTQQENHVLLSDETLQDVIKNMPPEIKLQFYKALENDLESGGIDLSNIQLPPAPKRKPKAQKSEDGRIYCCVECGSANIKKNGFTSAETRRYKCNDCRVSFTENTGAAIKWKHISDDQLRIILSGFINNHSMTVIAMDADVSPSTVCNWHKKVCNAIMQMYGYSDKFRGVAQVDEYYCRESFKGKRDAEFFIYTLGRMPRHHRNRQEKIEWLQKNGLYDRLLAEEPDRLEELLSDDADKRKRGISNDQICVLTLVDDNGAIYIEPVSVGRLEKAMAKLKLKNKFEGDGTIMVSDEHNAYDKALYGTGVKHEKIKASEHKKRKYTLAGVNGLHSEMTKFMNPYTGKIYNTKYLDLTLIFFWWLQKHKDYNTQQKVEVLFKIMNDDITDLEAKERVDLITYKELSEREITLDTKGQFPTKL